MKGRVITNLDNKAKIILAKTGWRHTLFTNQIVFQNIIIFKKLREVIRKAKFDSFGKPDENDSKNTLGFLNYRCKVIINGKNYKVKISVRMDVQGKFYYDHYVKK